MAEQPWKAPNDVKELASALIAQHHPHLAQASIGVGFTDTKIFNKGSFNWGSVSKFSKLAKLWHAKDRPFDFSILLCADAWYKFLTQDQREAYLDLNLSRCQVEYQPVCVEQNGKKITVKDEWGRVEYTDQVKTEDDGSPVWKKVSLSVDVIAANIKRHGLWCADFLNLKSAIELKEQEQKE